MLKYIEQEQTTHAEEQADVTARDVFTQDVQNGKHEVDDNSAISPFHIERQEDDREKRQVHDVGRGAVYKDSLNVCVCCHFIILVKFK